MFILHSGARHSVRVFKYVCVWVCVHVCVYIYSHTYMYACICKWTLEQQEFELHGSTYVNFFPPNTYRSTFWSKLDWMCGYVELTYSCTWTFGWRRVGTPTPYVFFRGQLYLCVCVCVCVCVCERDRFSFNFQNQLYKVGAIVLQFIDTETELENSVGHPTSHTHWNTQVPPSCAEKVDSVKETPP